MIFLQVFIACVLALGTGIVGLSCLGLFVIDRLGASKRKHVVDTPEAPQHRPYWETSRGEW